jgi:hypothetical protein
MECLKGFHMKYKNGLSLETMSNKPKNKNSHRITHSK